MEELKKNRNLFDKWFDMTEQEREKKRLTYEYLFDKWFDIPEGIPSDQYTDEYAHKYAIKYCTDRKK